MRTQTTEARNLIESTLLVSWANAVLNGDGGDAELDRVRMMSQAMQRVAGDALYADAVSAIDRASAGGSPLRQLAEAHRDYAAAAALFNDDRFAARRCRRLQSCTSRFGSSPFAVMAALHQGAIAYVSGRPAEAEALAAGHAGDRPRKGLRIRRRALDLVPRPARNGTGPFRRRPVAATRRRSTRSTRMGDVEQAGAAHNLLAALHDYLGDAASAWQHRLIAFKSLSASRSLRFKYQVLGTAVPALRSLKVPRRR